MKNSNKVSTQNNNKNNTSLQAVKLFSTLILLLALAIIVAKSLITLQVEHAINSLFYSIPKSLDIITVNITHLGSLAMLYSAALVTYILNYKKLSLKLLVSGLGAYVFAGFLKELVMRPRPFDVWQEIIAREYGKLGYGFPSGHTALIVAVSVVLWSYAKKEQRIVLVATAVLVALSRMVLGVHMPLDLVGGLLIGLITGFGANLLIDKTLLKNK